MHKMSNYFFDTRKPGLTIDAGPMGNQTRCLFKLKKIFKQINNYKNVEEELKKLNQINIKKSKSFVKT